MDKIKNFRDWVIKNSPGYETHIAEERTKTSKMLYARRRVSFTRIFAPGIHIEAEEYIMDKRLKGGILRHFRYFGPRGEILFYFALVLGLRKLFVNNLDREDSIDSVLNDRNVYLRTELPFEDRKIR